MAITRDQDVPESLASLFQTFVHASDGHESSIVLEAAANFLVAAIHNHVMLCGGTADGAHTLAAHLGRKLPILVADQWQRSIHADDVKVHRNGN